MGAAPRGAPSEGPGVDGGVLVPARPAAPAAEEDDDDAWRRLLGPPAAPATPIARADDMQDASDDDDVMMRVGPAAVVELYSPPRVTATLPRPSVARALGPAPVGDKLVAGSTFDLHADVDGMSWDFSKPLDRKRAGDRLRAEEPLSLIHS